MVGPGRFSTTLMTQLVRPMFRGQKLDTDELRFIRTIRVRWFRLAPDGWREWSRDEFPA